MGNSKNCNRKYDHERVDKIESREKTKEMMRVK